MSSHSTTNADVDDSTLVELHFELQTDRDHAFQYDEIMIKCIAEVMEMPEHDVTFDGVEEIIQNEKHFGLFHGYIATTLGEIEELVSRFFNAVDSNRLEQLIIQQSGHDAAHPLEIRELYETDRHQIDPRWIQLKCLSKVIGLDLTNLTSVNGNRFVVGLLHENMITNSHHIWEYYGNVDEWKHFSSIEIPLKLTYPAIVCDNEHDERLFIIGGEDKSDLMIIEGRKNLNVIKQHIFIGNYPKMIFINDELHIIGGTDNPRHLVWAHTKMNEKFDIIHTFEAFGRLINHGLIYIKSQNKMLMFGGWCTEKDIDGLEMACDTIYEYSLKRNKWRLLNVTLPIKMHSFGYVLIPNQRYIVLFGGMFYKDNDDKWTSKDSIYVWDLRMMTFHLSSIVCPLDSTFSAIVLSDMDKDQLVIFGYLREQCMKNEIMLPHDIIGLIVKLFHVDWIHLMSLYINGTDQHWKIAVDDIISSIS